MYSERDYEQQQKQISRTPFCLSHQKKGRQQRLKQAQEKKVQHFCGLLKEYCLGYLKYKNTVHASFTLSNYLTKVNSILFNNLKICVTLRGLSSSYAYFKQRYENYYCHNCLLVFYGFFIFANGE
jgi:hypothetical protein